MADMARKDRQGNRKLTSAQATQIRLRDHGNCWAIGREFGVSPGVVTKIRSGKIWKHVLP
jgi:hypothetical protein